MEGAQRDTAPLQLEAGSNRSGGPDRGRTRPASKSPGSYTLLNSDHNWKIAHFQNTTVDPDKEDIDPTMWAATVPRR
jgi:hypothetical protein